MATSPPNTRVLSWPEWVTPSGPAASPLPNAWTPLTTPVPPLPRSPKRQPQPQPVVSPVVSPPASGRTRTAVWAAEVAAAEEAVSGAEPGRWRLTRTGPKPPVVQEGGAAQRATPDMVAARRAAFSDALRARRVSLHVPPPTKVLYAAPLERDSPRNARCRNQPPFLDSQSELKSPPGTTETPHRAAIGKKCIKVVSSVGAGSGAGAEEDDDRVIAEAERLRGAYQRVIARCAATNAVREAQGLMLDLAWRHWDEKSVDVSSPHHSAGSPISKICHDKLVNALKGFPDDHTASENFALKDVPSTTDLGRRPIEGKDENKVEKQEEEKDKKEIPDRKSPVSKHQKSKYPRPASASKKLVVIRPPPPSRFPDRPPNPSSAPAPSTKTKSQLQGQRSPLRRGIRQRQAPLEQGQDGTPAVTQEETPTQGKSPEQKEVQGGQRQKRSLTTRRNILARMASAPRTPNTPITSSMIPVAAIPSAAAAATTIEYGLNYVD